MPERQIPVPDPILAALWATERKPITLPAEGGPQEAQKNANA